MSMLYQFYETQRALLSPFAEFSSASSKLYSHPLSPFTHTPMAPRVSAGLNLMHRLSKAYEKPEFNIHSVKVDGVDVAVQQQVTIEKPFCRLLRFKRFTDDLPMLKQMKDQPTVLVVAPLSGHHSTLLRETVRELLQHHKVYITDWTDARMVPVEAGPFHLDDYIEYIQDFIRHIGPEVNVISVCQPTVPVLAAISLMASRGEKTPRTMTMMGGPIDARRSPTAVNNLAMNKSHEWFESNVIFPVPTNYPGSQRLVYPGFMQHTGFIAMNPSHHLRSHYDYYMDLMRGEDENADFHRNFYDEYNAVLDMPAEYYLDTIRVVFQDFSLVNGTWDVRGERVRPQDIKTTALLTIEGEKDDISGAGQTRAAHDLCTGIDRKRQFHYDAMGAGHYGIFSGRRWREDVYPQVRDFIATHQLHKAAPPTRVRPPARAAARSKQPSAAAATQLTLVDAAPSTPPVQHVAAVKQVASALKAVARTSRASAKTTAVTLAPALRKAAAPKLTPKAKASVKPTKAAAPISAARKAVPKTPRAK